MQRFCSTFCLFRALFCGTVFFLCLGMVMPAVAASGAPEDSQSLNGEWMRRGGARLYWNTLMYPAQIRMGGASFRDPASVPELAVPKKAAKPTRKRSATKKTAPAQVQASAAPAAATTVPKPGQTSPALTVTQPLPPTSVPAVTPPSQQSLPPPSVPAVTPSSQQPLPPLSAVTPASPPMQATLRSLPEWADQ